MAKDKDPYEDLLDLTSWGDGWFEAKAQPFGLKFGVQLLLTAAGLAALVFALSSELFIAFCIAVLAGIGAWRLNRKLPDVFVRFERGSGGISFRWGEKKIFKRIDSVLIEVCKVKIYQSPSYLVVRLHGKVFGRRCIELILDTKDLEMAYALAVSLQGYVRNDQIPGGAPSAPVKPHTPISNREARRAFTVAAIAVAIVFLLVWLLSLIE